MAETPSTQNPAAPSNPADSHHAGQPTPLPPTVPAEQARSTVQAVAFDCYGTLLQLEERQFASLIHEMLIRHGVAHTDGEAVWQAWLDASRALSRQEMPDPDDPLGGPEPIFRPFAETWPRFFAAAFAEHSIDAIPPQTAFQYLWDVMSASPAYPEVLDVFAELRSRGYRLAIGSNADDGHLLPALSTAGIAAELILSSEGARSYKPRRPFFAQLCDGLNLRPEQVLYVGDSPWADVMGANHAGLPVYHVRRYPDPEREARVRHRPTWQGETLSGLLEVLPTQV